MPPDPLPSDSHEERSEGSETSDEWSPRLHDHLVEPMFGGLGVGQEEAAFGPKIVKKRKKLGRMRLVVGFALGATLLYIVAWILTATG